MLNPKPCYLLEGVDNANAPGLPALRIEPFLCADWLTVPMVKLAVRTIDTEVSACIDVLIALD